MHYLLQVFYAKFRAVSDDTASNSDFTDIRLTVDPKLFLRTSICLSGLNRDHFGTYAAIEFRRF